MSRLRTPGPLRGLCRSCGAVYPYGEADPFWRGLCDSCEFTRDARQRLEWAKAGLCVNTECGCTDGQHPTPLCDEPRHVDAETLRAELVREWRARCARETPAVQR